MKTKIKIYLLAVDSSSDGTEVEWFYSERARYAALLDAIGDPDEEGAALLAAAQQSGDNSELDKWIDDKKDPLGSFTYQTDEAHIDVIRAEASDHEERAPISSTEPALIAVSQGELRSICAGLALYDADSYVPEDDLTVTQIEALIKRLQLAASNLHPDVLTIVKAYEHALNASDTKHPAFRDSCADVVEHLWTVAPMVRVTLATLEGVAS
jgi:hypothetical protein